MRIGLELSVAGLGENFLPVPNSYCFTSNFASSQDLEAIIKLQIVSVVSVVLLFSYDTFLHSPT